MTIGVRRDQLHQRIQRRDPPSKINHAMIIIATQASASHDTPNCRCSTRPVGGVRGAPREQTKVILDGDHLCRIVEADGSADVDRLRLILADLGPEVGCAAVIARLRKAAKTRAAVPVRTAGRSSSRLRLGSSPGSCHPGQRSLVRERHDTFAAMDAAFVPGLTLAEAFYTEAVHPLLRVPHTACLLGEGSEVLGFDTPRSRDHEWGPRVQILVAAEHVDGVSHRVAQGLPPVFRGFDTAWFRLATGTVTHHVEVTTLDEWIVRCLGFDPRPGMDTARWLGTPQQRLLHVTAGRVFHDDFGELTRLRRALSWYPLDVWRWMTISAWHLIGNIQPLRARCLEVGDILGARLLTAKLCRLVMDLTFLQERHYHPYDKWYGTAFARLDAAAVLTPLLENALSATEPPSSATSAISQALLEVGRRHNGLGLSASVTPRIGPFEVGINNSVRPYEVVNAADFIDATRDAITDPGLRKLIQVGAIDQLTHADDAVVTHTDWPAHIIDGYRREMDSPT
jgi:hypothetical protein